MRLGLQAECLSEKPLQRCGSADKVVWFLLLGYNRLHERAVCCEELMNPVAAAGGFHFGRMPIPNLGALSYPSSNLPNVRFAGLAPPPNR